MERRFKKIKYKAGKVILAYEQLNKAGEWDTYTMESTEAPIPAFDLALQGLRRPLLDEVELSEVEPSELTIGSVSLSWTETEDQGTVMGAVISAVRVLKKSNSPMVINSPFKPEQPYTEDGDTDVCLSDDTVEAIELLRIEAIKYIDGERAQTDLFSQKNEPDEEWDENINNFINKMVEVVEA